MAYTLRREIAPIEANVPKQILIVGAGKVGRALAQGWLDAGHDVRFGVPNPHDRKYADVSGALLGPAGERRGAEIVVLATPFGAARSAIEALGDLAGAIVIDCTNPLTVDAHGLMLLFGHETSGAEQIATWAKGAHVFKTLNQTGVENITDANAYDSKPVMFVAGDDSDDKAVVMNLVSDLGLRSVDAGPLTAARLLEPLAMLWIELAMKRGHGRQFAFAVVQPGGAGKSD